MALDIGLMFPRIERKFGAERLTLDIATELCRTNRVTLYTMSMSEDLIPENVRVVQLGSKASGHALTTLKDWFLMPRLARRVGNHDALLALNYQSALGATLAARRTGAPFIYYCTEPPRFLYDLRDIQGRQFPGLGLAARALKRLDKWAVSGADSIASISDWTQQQVQQIYGVDSAVIYPGIDTDALLAIDRDTARKAVGVEADIPLYVSLSKLHPRKRIETLMDHFIAACKGKRNAQLIIAGEGPDESRLKDYAQTLGDPRIRFIGYVSEEDRKNWLRAADVFLFNARDEPFGLAPLEAKISGAQIQPIEPGYPVLSLSESTARLKALLLCHAEHTQPASRGQENGQ